MALLVDTGILYALTNKRDSWNGRAKQLLRASRELLIVPGSVIPEACFLVHRSFGGAGERRLLEDFRDFSLVRPLHCGKFDLVP